MRPNTITGLLGLLIVRTLRRHRAAICFGLVWCLCAGAIAWLLSQEEHGSSYIVDVDTVVAVGSDAVGVPLRMEGELCGPVEIDDGLASLTLTHNGAVLPVHYRGGPPEILREDFPMRVVVAGSLSDDGVFDAHEIVIRCPSKYEAGMERRTRAACPSPPTTR